MIGHKNVIGIITMSLLVFVLAACNPSSQDVNDSNDFEKDANMIKKSTRRKTNDTKRRTYIGNRMG